MTKSVRVENADGSDYQVVVEVWDKNYSGGPDTLSESTVLKYPTALETFGITSSRYLVVREIPKDRTI